MDKQPYIHPFLSYDALAAQLAQRGVAGEPAFITRKLMEVGYQRLSAYWLPFSDAHGGVHVDFDTIWYLYCLDCRLRALLLEALSRIEVTVRNRLVHFFAEEYGAFGYLKRQNLPHAGLDVWRKWSKKQRDAASASKAKLVTDFFLKYSDKRLPIWIACELMDFGSTVVLFGSVEQQVQKKTSRSLGINNPRILHSWLRALNDVRNACAHHNRVWNRAWVKQPSLPQNEVCWTARYSTQSECWEPVPRTSSGNIIESAFDITKTGVMLTICKVLLDKIDAESDWSNRVKALLKSDAMTPSTLSWMGLPSHWQEHPLWK